MKTKHPRRNFSLLAKALAGLPPLAQTVTAQQWSTNTLPTGLVSWWNADGNTLDVMGVNDAASSGQTYGPGRFGQSFHLMASTNPSPRPAAPT